MIPRQRHRPRGISTVALCAALGLCLTVAQAQTNVHRWVDKEGKVHFSDLPPPENARDATQKRMGGDAVAAPQLPYATQEAAKRNPVTLYSSKNCGDLCLQGRALLAKRGIPFTERQADVDPADRERVKQLTGKLQVPVLLVGEKYVQGYAEEPWNAALDAAGYARTGLPGQVTPQPPSDTSEPVKATAQTAPAPR